MAKADHGRWFIGRGRCQRLDEVALVRRAGQGWCRPAHAGPKPSATRLRHHSPSKLDRSDPPLPPLHRFGQPRGPLRPWRPRERSRLLEGPKPETGEHRTTVSCPEPVRTGHENIFTPGQAAPVMRYFRIALRQLLPETSGPSSQLRHAPPTPSRSSDRAGEYSSWSGASSRRCRDGRERDLVPNSRWNALARPDYYRSCPGLTRQSPVGPADVNNRPELSPEQLRPGERKRKGRSAQPFFLRGGCPSADTRRLDPNS
jgi:hypothetical protein